MLRVITSTKIIQTPSDLWPNRKGILNLDFLTYYEADDSWRDFTNAGMLTIPKALGYRDSFGKLRPLFGTNVNIGGFDSNTPLFLRGDRVIMSEGYKYFAQKNDKRETTNLSQFYSGFISGVGSKIPIELKLEDNMWLLKQTPMETRTFKKSEGLNVILKAIIDKCNSTFHQNLTFNALTQTTFGDFCVGNETASQVLQRLQKVYGFESYFRDNELRCGAIIYIPSEAVTRTFTFQKDIIDDGENLEYVRKDDLTLSAIARNTIEETTDKLTKDGHAKTKKVRLEVLVTLKNNKTTIKEIKRGEKVVENIEGERRTLFFPGAKTINGPNGLADLAIKELTKYYYTGLRGYFTTFGLPFVRQGDNVSIIHPILPEQNGTFKVKQVKRKGGAEDGHRQEIYLDFKLNL